MKDSLTADNKLSIAKLFHEVMLNEYIQTDIPIKTKWSDIPTFVKDMYLEEVQYLITYPIVTAIDFHNSRIGSLIANGWGTGRLHNYKKLVSNKLYPWDHLTPAAKKSYMTKINIFNKWLIEGIKTTPPKRWSSQIAKSNFLSLRR